MTNLIKYFSIGVILTSLLGPSVRLPILEPPVNVYISDIFIIILSLQLIVKHKEILKIIKTDIASQIFILFNIFALFTLLFTPINLIGFEKTISFLYLFRYFAYFSLYLAVRFITGEGEKNSLIIRNILNFCGFSFIFIGWMQYFLYPDLRNLEYLGWDPHYKRIFALIFDPNYLGLILVFFFIIRHQQKLRGITELILQISILLTLGFTYSRSSYVSFFAAFIYPAFVKNRIIPYLATSLLFIFSLLLLPRPGGEGVKLERLFSVTERISNWRAASVIVVRYPVFGIGFNTLRYARKNFNLLPQNWLTSHSTGGVDNSYLYVAATTGIIGLLIFILFLLCLLKQSTLTGKSVLIAAIIHSFFLNSLFFNFILIWLWSILALEKNNEFKGNI